MPTPDQPPRTPDFVTLRELTQPIVRYRSVAFLTFLCLFGSVLGVVALMKPEYEASMKVLVKRERMDPVMTASPAEQSRDRVEVTEDELNSEVELLKSRDLLQRVALEVGLVKPPGDASLVEASSATPQSLPSVPGVVLSRAVNALQQGLQVEAIRKSTLIQLRYRSIDPEQAASVLSNLARFYVEKHLALQRPLGAYEFFHDQTRTFSDKLGEAEAQLAAFGRSRQVVAPVSERDSTLTALAEFEASLLRTRTQMAEVEQRMSTLARQIDDTPTRQTTQMHTATDVERIRDLKSKIFDMERKQADMLRFFNPQYPPVLQLADQLAQARTALAETERTPVSSLTSDQNPTHQWLRDEAARARTERDGLMARVQALTRSVDEYRAKAVRLDEVRAQQDGLLRAVKTARDNFELYQRKQEEARISDALDRTRVADVVVAEEPVVPTLPSNSRRLALAFLGFVLSGAGGIAAAVVCHYANPYFRAGDEVQAFLGVPVLATLPAEARARI